MIILASQSTTRIRLLRAAGLSFRSEAHHVDEETAFRDLPPSPRAANLARAKAFSISAQHSGGLVIGSDQVLECEGQSLAKPATLAAAHAVLMDLQGKTHHLHTAVSCVAEGREVFFWLETCNLHMRVLSAAAIDRYLERAGTEILGCAGAYMIEGLGIQLFERIDGDFFCIQGIPILPLLGFLRQEGYLPS